MVRCTGCDAQAHEDEAALTWSCERNGGARRWHCAACTRRHARSIEAKLDVEHW